MTENIIETSPSRPLSPSLPPQFWGAVNVLKEALEKPGDKKALVEMAFAGLNATVQILTAAESSIGGFQGRLNSRRQRLSPQEQADRVAKEMLKAGKTPQEIGAVVAGILGFKS